MKTLRIWTRKGRPPPTQARAFPYTLLIFSLTETGSRCDFFTCIQLCSNVHFFQTQLEILSTRPLLEFCQSGSIQLEFQVFTFSWNSNTGLFYSIFCFDLANGQWPSMKHANKELQKGHVLVPHLLMEDFLVLNLIKYNNGKFDKI